MKAVLRPAFLLVAACALWSGCAGSGSGASNADATAVPVAGASPVSAQDAALRAALQQNINLYLKTRARPEHLSAVSFSLSRPGNPENINLTAGTNEFGGGGGDVTPSGLYQVGSITKSFTSVAILHLAAAGKLGLDDTVGKWLPQYPAWKSITIRRLLNMTSGIPTYDETPAFQSAFAKDPMHFFSAAQLVSFVYPLPGHAAVLKPGYYYSNTAYILAQMIAQRASGVAFDGLIRGRVIAPQHLTDTFYDANVYPPAIRARTVPGYFVTRAPEAAGLNALYGKNVRDFSLSWAQGAGGIVATPEDVTRWARALFEGPLLAPTQRAEMQSIVSFATGKPIAVTSVKDPNGFGLGLAQNTNRDMGTYWYYQGGTMGYRVVYVYFPASRIIYAVGLNSQPDEKQDQLGHLILTIFKTLQMKNAI